MDLTERFQCLGHSKWTNCSLLNPLCSPNFPTFSLSLQESNSYYTRWLIMRKGNPSKSRNGPDREVAVPGAFKLDLVQPVEPLLFAKFSNFFTFIMGVQLLLPQRANYEKREFTQLQKWTRHRGFSAWGNQTGPIAVCCASFVHQIFQLFHFQHGSPILITPEG